MAYEYLTLLDLAKMNGSDMTVGLIEENLNSAPELEVLPARQVAGTSFKTLVRTAYPSTGFRGVNEGVEPKKSTYENRLFNLYYYDGQMEVDNAAAVADEQGIDHALAMEADGHGRAFLLTGGSQVWYGVSNDANGFPGAQALVDSSMVKDAGGTTASTGSSVYAVVARPKFMEVIVGNNTTLEVGEWRKQTITRSSKELTAWKNSLEGYIGVAWYSKYAVARLKDITEDSGKTLTDAKLADLFSVFPVGVQPTHIFMSRRSRSQLQASRTVTLFGNGRNRPDQEVVAPLPTEYEGVPIITTDSLTNTETLS